LIFNFKGKKWDILIVDVNSNDPESDLWVPTYDFVEVDFLKNCASILAQPNGNLKQIPLTKLKRSLLSKNILF
jgi:hypothetical protein